MTTWSKRLNAHPLPTKKCSPLLSLTFFSFSSFYSHAWGKYFCSFWWKMAAITSVHMAGLCGLKKCIKTPEIPSKHVRNWVPKVLEQRRQGLETYLQAVILENEELPKLFLDFLNVRHLPSLPKTESYGSFDETESEESSKLSHQPVLLFLRDPYVLPAASDFPNVVIEGVLHGIFYPHLQPR
uniref:Sorting nexin 2 n=1 Tax=Bos indicus x Bos taurus TaxID=30522 RepID=A0A4W2I5C6_BOBOX